MPSGVWVDVESPTATEVAQLRQLYPLNSLALADAQEIGHWSRFERYPEHLFLIFRTLESPQSAHSRTERVSFFYCPAQEVLLTYRNEHVHYLEQTWESFQGAAPLHLMYRLLDLGVETFFAFTDSLSDRVEDLEETALEGTEAGFTQMVFAVRREALAIRRLNSQGREALAHLERLSELGAEAYLFRDLSDRMTRIYEGLDTARESLSAALEVYLSAQNNRLNLVLQRLTVLSTLLLPMSLWAGIYGTNFETFGIYKWAGGQTYFWLGLAVIGLGLAAWMRWKRWW